MLLYLDGGPLQESQTTGAFVKIIYLTLKRAIEIIDDTCSEPKMDPQRGKNPLPGQAQCQSRKGYQTSITPSIVYKRHAIRDTSQIFEKNKRQRLVSAIDLRDS